MKFKFWDRLREQEPDLSIADEQVRAARQRLHASDEQRCEAHRLKERAERTRRINHWSPMVEAAWADAIRREP